MAIPYPSTTIFPWQMQKHGLVHIFLFSECTLCVRFASSTLSSFRQFEDAPQGSMLSTSLFLIALDRLVSALPSGIWLSLYVDDLAIFASGSFILALHQSLQSALTSISSATNHGFQFSTYKTFPSFLLIHV